MIALLHKKKEKDLFKNYRPVALLCSDYKLFTAILADRLAKVIHHLIPACQTGFVPGRFICENSMFTSMLAAYMKHTKKEGCVICWDAEKAYDRVSWKYLFRMMEAFGIPEGFRHMVGMCYKEGQVSSAIMVNGHMSSFFSVGASVRQGCPASCSLFLLAVEGLGLLLDKHRLMRGAGIKLPSGQVITRTMFADDSTVYLNSATRIADAEAVAMIYCKASGAHLNVDKTVGMYVDGGESRGAEASRSTF